MLQIFIAWIYIYITSYCAGHLLLGLFNRGHQRDHVHPALVSVSGLILIMVVAGYFSLVAKTGIIINIIISIFSFLYIIWHRHSLFSFNWLATNKTAAVITGLIFLFSVFVLVLVKAAGPITTPDSGAYHLPFIKWIENYKVIKGIANVHSRYGFNYQYHVLCAVYGFSFLKIPTMHAMNGYLMFALIAYLVTTISYLKAKVFSVTDLIRIIILFFVLNMSNAVSSFSPDFPATALIIFIILLTISHIEQGIQYSLHTGTYLVFILSVGAVLFKISSVPVLLFNLFYIIPLAKSRKWQKVGAFVLAGLILCIPYLIRNYFISGYLVYPLYSVDLFNVPWKVPLEKVVIEKNVIRYYALGIDYGNDTGFPGVLTAWWRYLKATNRVYIYIIELLLLCTVFNISTLIPALAGWKNIYGKYKYLFLLLYICLLYWWWNAPDPRFGNGYIIPFIAINISFAGYFIAKKTAGLLVNFSFVILTVFAVLMIKGKALSKVGNNFNIIHYNFIKQEGYPPPGFLSIIREGGKVFYKVPNDDFCWDAPQPCSLQFDNYTYIGNTVEEGFKPLPANF